MDMNSFLVWWLLVAPLAIAFVDRMMMAGGTTSGAGRADAMRSTTDPSRTTMSSQAMR